MSDSTSHDACSMFIDPEMFIEYTFSFESGRVLHYRVPFHRERPQADSASELSEEDFPSWTRLEYQQCANCPLDAKTSPCCPVALDAKDVILGFREVLSYREGDVRVTTPDREYFKRCDAQTGLRSIIGFVMATSSCPILAPLRGMAHFHLPFASLDEIVYRATSSYLLSQYFHYKDGTEADLDLSGLKAQYQEIQTLNYHFLQRIRAASDGDASLDVLSTLFSISSLFSFNLEQHLEQLRPLFTLDPAKPES